MQQVHLAQQQQHEWESSSTASTGEQRGSGQVIRKAAPLTQRAVDGHRVSHHAKEWGVLSSNCRVDAPVLELVCNGREQVGK